VRKLAYWAELDATDRQAVLDLQYELPITQEQLADCTGLTSVHVNRTLKALEAEGLIERRSSRTVTIGDWRKLAAAGDFDSTYLHLCENEAG
jgi:DNA-binding transcriptional regulator LsrR (DeoR family)